MNKSPFLQKSPYKKLLLQSLFVFFVFFLIVAVAIAGVGAGIVSAYTKSEKIRTKEDFDKQLETMSQTSYAYFREENGKTKKVGMMINPDDRQLVTDLKQVSPYLLNAFISIEDKGFYNHSGIVPRSILRAAYQQFTGSDVSTGGSTLTQQLIKTHFLDYKDKSLKRKSVEIVNALRIEKYYDKPEIFIKYMNSVYFGEGAHGKNMYGVNAAARGLFNKQLKDLTLAQAAYIAGMVQRPNAYNPFRGEEELKYGLERMELVLQKMLEEGKITQQQRDKALKFNIKKSLAKPSMFTNGYDEYPFIITAAEKEAVEILKGIDQKNPKATKKSDEYYTKLVRQGGLQIYTTIDQKMYEKVNEVGQSLKYPTRTYKGIKIKEQIGATIVDNKTGGILAFYAGKFDENEENHALNSKNQPGSSIKPLIVYGPGLNEGVISPGSIVIDEPIKKMGTDKVYRNAGGNYSGRVTATTALKKSLNIPAIKILRKLGVQKGFEYLKKINLPPDEKDGEALALGGSTYGYTVADMTGAFAMIANYGKFNEAHVIDKIVTSDGKEIYNFKRDKGSKQVFSPQASYQLIKMLRGVVTGGTAAGSIGSRTYGYNIAGKTGTTTSQYDLWFVGFTPEISLGVWSGYDYNFVGNSHLAKNAWVKIFQAAAKLKPELIKKESKFKDPGGKLKSQCFECNKKPKHKPKKKKEEPQRKRHREEPRREERPREDNNPGQNRGGNEQNGDDGGNQTGGDQGNQDDGGNETGGNETGGNENGGNEAGGNGAGGENSGGEDNTTGSIEPPPGNREEGEDTGDWEPEPNHQSPSGQTV